MGFTVSIRYNLIPQVRLSIADKSEAAVRDNAKAVQALCHANAPRRTGALSESWYVNGPQRESDYGQRASAAIGMNPKARIVPELQAATVDPKAGVLRDPATGRFTQPQAIVASAVEYSLYLEEGTVHMAPRPTLRPAALIVERAFISDMSKVASGF